MATVMVAAGGTFFSPFSLGADGCALWGLFALFLCCQIRGIFKIKNLYMRSGASIPNKAKDDLRMCLVAVTRASLVSFSLSSELRTGTA